MSALRNRFWSAFAALLPLAAIGCSSGSDTKERDAPPTPAMEADVKGLCSEDARERAKSRERLLTHGPGVVRALGRELASRVESGDTGPGFASVVRLLGAFGGPDAAEPLRGAALKRALEPALRVEAIRSLGMTGAASVAGTLAECTAEEEPLPVRLAAAAALAAFTETGRARDALKTVAMIGPDPLREEACRSLVLCDGDDMREFFLVRLVDRSPSIRLSAVSYFRKHPCTEAAAPLGVLARQDRDLRVVMAAGKALEGIGGREGR